MISAQMKRTRTHWLARLQLLAILFLVPAGSSLAATPCVPPAELRAKLPARPTADALATLGNWFADHKEFDCAATSFASAFKLQRPESSSLAYLWGLSLHSAKHDAEALAPLTTASKLDPSDVRPHLALGAALDRLKKTDQAEAEWRAALAIDPESATALDALSQDFVDQRDYPSVIALLDKPGSQQVRSSLQNLNLGVAYASTAQLKDAIRVLQEGINNDPDSLPIADELGMVLMLVGRDKEAFAMLELTLEKHPDAMKTQILYLRTLVSSHSEKAPQVAKRLLSAYPDQWEVQYLAGVLESREGDFQTAVEHLKRAVALNPDSDDAQENLGNSLASLGDLPGARQHLEKAIALGDNQPEVEYSLAMVLKRLGDTAQAQEKLQVYQQLKSLRSNRAQAAGKAEEGDQAMTEGDAAKAATLYKEALEANPKEPLLYYKLSRALDKAHDIPGETAALQQAIQLNPNLPEAQNQMGFLVVRSGDAAKAEDYFQAAVHASPSFIVAWINLAATQASEAKWADAKQSLNHALAIDPDNAEARKLGQALSEAHPGP